MTNKTGTLYLCATPIGNLEDMTYRVVRTLNEVDVIAAEDTRNSIKLLNHFDIHTPMTSYHEYNKIEKGRILVRQMLEGQNVALITDAGMPGISDPGEELVRMCRDAGVPVTALPGVTHCRYRHCPSRNHPRKSAASAAACHYLSWYRYDKQIPGRPLLPPDIPVDDPYPDLLPSYPQP